MRLGSDRTESDRFPAAIALHLALHLASRTASTPDVSGVCGGRGRDFPDARRRRGLGPSVRGTTFGQGRWPVIPGRAVRAPRRARRARPWHRRGGAATPSPADASAVAARAGPASAAAAAMGGRTGGAGGGRGGWRGGAAAAAAFRAAARHRAAAGGRCRAGAADRRGGRAGARRSAAAPEHRGRRRHPRAVRRPLLLPGRRARARRAVVRACAALVRLQLPRRRARGRALRQAQSRRQRQGQPAHGAPPSNSPGRQQVPPPLGTHALRLLGTDSASGVADEFFVYRPSPDATRCSVTASHRGLVLVAYQAGGNLAPDLHAPFTHLP